MVGYKNEVCPEGSIDSQIARLLNAAKTAVDKHRELVARGSMFNCFCLLGMRKKEVFHSRVIRMLLDQQTQHGCGVRFWNLFFDCLKQLLPACEKIDFLECYEVSCEYYLGPISEDYEHGGYIDILVRTSNSILVFENKIDAVDQPKQLYRYANWAKSEGQKCKTRSFVFYLTPNGHLPARESVRGANGEVEVYCISYEFVENWIEVCRRNCDKSTRIYMFLTQYLELVREITGKRKDCAVMQIKQYLTSQHFLAAARAVKFAYDEAKNEIVKTIVTEACHRAGIEVTPFLQNEIARFATGMVRSDAPCVIAKIEKPYITVALAYDAPTILGLAIPEVSPVREKIISIAQGRGVLNYRSTDIWPVHFSLDDDIFDDYLLDEDEKREAITNKMADYIKVSLGILKECTA